MSSWNRLSLQAIPRVVIVSAVSCGAPNSTISTKLRRTPMSLWDSLDYSPTRSYVQCGRPIFGTGQASNRATMLTNKGKYGLKAADIAESNSISKKFLDHILSELRYAGLVHSKKGKGGGCALARPAHEIRVGAIVRALDGRLAPIPCASVTAFRPCEDCGDLETCAVRPIMVEARNAIANVLDNRTLAELRTLTNPPELAATYHI